MRTAHEDWKCQQEGEKSGQKGEASSEWKIE